MNPLDEDMTAFVRYRLECLQKKSIDTKLSNNSIKNNYAKQIIGE